MLREHQESVQKWKEKVEQQEEEDRVRREKRRQELMTMEDKYNDLPPWPKVGMMRMVVMVYGMDVVCAHTHAHTRACALTNTHT